MSSFVIDKVEYIKAAGVIAGIFEVKKRRGDMWMYDYHNNVRINDAADMYCLFTDFYFMNLRSVEDQYKEPHTEGDGLKYESEFQRYRNKGVDTAIFSGERFARVLKKLNVFFQGALYQVENDEYSTAMRKVFYEILSDLLEYYFSSDSEGWAEFNLD